MKHKEFSGEYWAYNFVWIPNAKDPWSFSKMGQVYRDVYRYGGFDEERYFF